MSDTGLTSENNQIVEKCKFQKHKFETPITFYKCKGCNEMVMFFKEIVKLTKDSSK